MITHKRQKHIHSYLLVAISCFSILAMIVGLLSCGKVSQEVGFDDEQKKSVELTYKIEIYSTPNLNVYAKEHPTIPTRNLLTYEDTPIHTQVAGLTLKQQTFKLTPLSWGKAILIDASVPVSPNQTVPTASATSEPKRPPIRKMPKFTSKAYDKNNLFITKSDHTIAYIKYDQSKSNWAIQCKKVAIDYSFYVVSVFSTADRYLVKIVDYETSVSGNQKISLGDITVYDTFISTIFLTEKTTNPDQENPAFLNELMDFFDESFFNQLHYQRPSNAIKKFAITEPRFTVSDPLITELLKIYHLYTTDPAEAKTYLEEREQPPFPSVCRRQLIEKCTQTESDSTN